MCCVVCVAALLIALLLTELETLYSHYLNGDKPPCYKLGNMYSISCTKVYLLTMGSKCQLSMSYNTVIPLYSGAQWEP